MVFDTQEQQIICLKMIEVSQFPGSMLEKALELKKAMLNAEITELKKAENK